MAEQGAGGPGAAMKVSPKGALSVYGLGRFPVTLYKEQWRKLLSMSSEITTFLDAHEDELKSKGDDAGAREGA